VIITKKALPRRTFLHGLGAAVALPLLDSMTPAFAEPSRTTVPRMAFLYTPNGVIMNDWTPAAEGAGYLMGVATRNSEGGRSDLVILDAERLDNGPIATVHLPMRAIGQIHGWWVPESQLPQTSA
jgi:hypothetical protein